MIRNLLKISAVAMATLALSVMAAPARAQNGAELVNQLCGKAEAPARSEAQLAEADQKAIDYLLPLMSAEDVGSRYAYQIMLQDMASYAARPGAENEREILAKVLVQTVERSNLENTVRHWIVLQIERIGKGESVPGLAKLMTDPDEHLRDCARRALEKNPDASATDALLQALAEAKDAKWKIGLINALGSREAGIAIGPCSEALGDSDPKVAAAAVTALSSIGGQQSATALFGVFDMPVSPLYMKAAQGLIDIAQEMLRHNEIAAAAEIYSTLYRGATDFAREHDDINPFNLRAAAIVGMMTCNPQGCTSEIAELMHDNDPKVRAAVVRATRHVESKVPLYALTALLLDLDPQSQVQVLGLIADRGDLSSIAPVKTVLSSSDESVRLAAIEALTKIGCDESAEALFEVAVTGSGASQRAAREGLAVMAGPRVEEIVAASAASRDVSSRVVAIGVLGKRRAMGTAETLLDYAATDNDDIRRAAFGALVDVADVVDVAAIVDRIARTKSPTVRDSGVAALRAALAAAKDKDATAAVVVGRMKTADPDSRIALLGSLDALGGIAALAAVCDAAQAADEALSNAGIRTLGNWPDFEGAETLVAIAAKPETSLTHYVLAVRGALRLIGAAGSASLDDRVTLCLAVLDKARRDDERRQAIAVLGTLPGPKAIDRLQDLLKNEALKTEAAMATVDLAGRLAATDRQAARNLAQKIRDMNVSEEINRRADGVISGRRGRGR